MLRQFSVYLLTLIVFLGIDLLWIGGVAQGLYLAALGDRLAAQPLWGVALIFYLFYVYGLFVFAIEPARKVQQLSTAIKKGALLGLFAYATYDLTNLATLKDWPWQISLIDMLWGMVLTAMVSAAGYAISQRLIPQDAP